MSDSHHINGAVIHNNEFLSFSICKNVPLSHLYMFMMHRTPPILCCHIIPGIQGVLPMSPSVPANVT